MANALSSFKKEIWDRRIQMDLNKSLVSLPLARFGFSEVTGATRFNRPQKSRLYATSYTAETPLNLQPLGSSNEYLDVDQTRAIHFFLDDTQKLETMYDIMNMYAPEAVYALRNEMDGKFFAQVTNAFYTVGKLDIEASGANTDGITASTSNILKTLSFSKAKLVQNRVETTTPFFVVLEPTIAAIWEQTLAGSGNNVADTTLRNGYVASLGALGLDLYVSNNLYHTQTLTGSGVFSNGETVVVGSQTLTMVTTIGSTPGNVLIGANLAASLTNLAAAINESAGAGTTYVALTQDERAKLAQNLVSATATATTLVINSAGFVSKSETGANASFGEHQCLSPLGQKGCIDMVIQKSVASENQRGTNKGVIGEYVITWTRYGLKTFNEGKQRFVALRFKM